MFRIVMSLVFVAVVVGAYFAANDSSSPTTQVQESVPPSGSTFNNL